MDANTLNLCTTVVEAAKDVLKIAIPLFGGYCISYFTRKENLSAEIEKNRKMMRLEIAKDEIRQKLALYKEVRVDFQKMQDEIWTMVHDPSIESWDEAKPAFVEAVSAKRSEIKAIKDKYLGRLDKPLMDKFLELLNLIDELDFDESGHEPQNVDEWEQERDRLGQKFADPFNDVLLFIEKNIDELIEAHGKDDV